jgi:hypothetical protein
MAKRTIDGSIDPELGTSYDTIAAMAKDDFKKIGGRLNAAAYVVEALQARKWRRESNERTAAKRKRIDEFFKSEEGREIAARLRVK